MLYKVSSNVHITEVFNCPQPICLPRYFVDEFVNFKKIKIQTKKMTIITTTKDETNTKKIR